MKYAIRCSCGKEHIVTEGAAGSVLKCTCGTDVEVPTMRELRKSAGVQAQSPTADRVISALLESNKLKAGNVCVKCQTGTNQSLTCRVICGIGEGFTRKPDRFFAGLFVFLGLLPALLMHSLRPMKTIDTEDRIYDLPLALCTECVKTTKDASSLRTVLMNVPEYCDLLKQYPEASVELLGKSK